MHARSRRGSTEICAQINIAENSLLLSQILSPASYPFMHSGPHFCSALKVPFTNLWCLPFKVLGNIFVARSVPKASFNALNPRCFRLVLTAPCAPLLCMSHWNNPPYLLLGELKYLVHDGGGRRLDAWLLVWQGQLLQQVHVGQGILERDVSRHGCRCSAPLLNPKQKRG